MVASCILRGASMPQCHLLLPPYRVLLTARQVHATPTESTVEFELQNLFEDTQAQDEPAPRAMQAAARETFTFPCAYSAPVPIPTTPLTLPVRPLSAAPTHPPGHLLTHPHNYPKTYSAQPHLAQPSPAPSYPSHYPYLLPQPTSPQPHTAHPTPSTSPYQPHRTLHTPPPRPHLTDLAPLTTPQPQSPALTKVQPFLARMGPVDSESWM